MQTHGGKQKAGEARRRVVHELWPRDANRFDELHASLCRNGVDAVGAVAYLSMLSRPAGLNPTGAEAD